MDSKTIRDYCAAMKAVTSDFPFDTTTRVYRVMNRIFVLMPDESDPPRMTLKCDPTLAEILRREFPAVTPGYHTNKRHWNTVVVDGSIPDAQIYEMIDHSYATVVMGLKKADQATLRDE